MQTKQMQIRDFHILGDASVGFKPMDGICQFMYRGKMVSVSTAGQSQGACQNEVAVFRSTPDGNFGKQVGLFHTVEDAIDFINAMENLKSVTHLGAQVKTAIRKFMEGEEQW